MPSAATTLWHGTKTRKRFRAQNVPTARCAPGCPASAASSPYAMVSPRGMCRSVSATERWNGVRGPNEQEMKATTVLELPLAEASVKVRSGGPLDDEADYALEVWAGQLPLRVSALSAPAVSVDRVSDTG